MREKFKHYTLSHTVFSVHTGYRDTHADTVLRMNFIVVQTIFGEFFLHVFLILQKKNTFELEKPHCAAHVYRSTCVSMATHTHAHTQTMKFLFFVVVETFK